jgi:hypothetical protein
VRLEDLLRGMGLVLLLLLAAEVGLEDAGRAHGQEIFIGDRLGLHQTLAISASRSARRPRRLACLACLGQR